MENEFRKPESVNVITHRNARVPKLSIKTSSLAELDTDSSPLLKSPSNAHSPTRKNFVITTSIGNCDMSPTFKGERSSPEGKNQKSPKHTSTHNMRLNYVRDWRKKVFQKPNKRPGSVQGAEMMMGFNGMSIGSPKKQNYVV